MSIVVGDVFCTPAMLMIALPMAAVMMIETEAINKVGQPARIRTRITYASWRTFPAGDIQILTLVSICAPCHKCVGCVIPNANIAQPQDGESPVLHVAENPNVFCNSLKTTQISQIRHTPADQRSKAKAASPLTIFGHCYNVFYNFNLTCKNLHRHNQWCHRLRCTQA